MCRQESDLKLQMHGYFLSAGLILRLLDNYFLLCPAVGYF